MLRFVICVLFCVIGCMGTSFPTTFSSERLPPSHSVFLSGNTLVSIESLKIAIRTVQEDGHWVINQTINTSELSSCSVKAVAPLALDLNHTGAVVFFFCSSRVQSVVLGPSFSNHSWLILRNWQDLDFPLSFGNQGQSRISAWMEEDRTLFIMSITDYNCEHAQVLLFHSNPSSTSFSFVILPETPVHCMDTSTPPSVSVAGDWALVGGVFNGSVGVRLYHWDTMWKPQVVLHPIEHAMEIAAALGRDGSFFAVISSANNGELQYGLYSGTVKEQTMNIVDDLNWVVFGQVHGPDAQQNATEYNHGVDLQMNDVMVIVSMWIGDRVPDIRVNSAGEGINPLVVRRYFRQKDKIVRGDTIVTTQPMATGNSMVLGDRYLLGKLAVDDALPADTVVMCGGNAHHPALVAWYESNEMTLSIPLFHYAQGSIIVIIATAWCVLVGLCAIVVQLPFVIRHHWSIWSVVGQLVFVLSIAADAWYYTTTPYVNSTLRNVTLWLLWIHWFAPLSVAVRFTTPKWKWCIAKTMSGAVLVWCIRLPVLLLVLMWNIPLVMMGAFIAVPFLVVNISDPRKMWKECVARRVGTYPDMALGGQGIIANHVLLKAIPMLIVVCVNVVQTPWMAAQVVMVVQCSLVIVRGIIGLYIYRKHHRTRASSIHLEDTSGDLSINEPYHAM